MYTRIIFICLLAWIVPFHSAAQVEKVFIEKYYVSDASDYTDTAGGKLAVGTTSYRIYVALKPGSKLKKIYGDANHALKFSSSQVFFNNLDGQTFAKDFLKSRYGENTIALDTWITLGQTTKKQGTKAYFGVPKNEDTDGSFIGGDNNDGGSAVVQGGLLVNNDPATGRPLTTADGMGTLTELPDSWTDLGFKNIATGADSTIFGSLVPGTEFTSNSCWLQNSGAVGVNADSNQVLIAQLTTKGTIEFEINLEVEELVDGAPVTVKYVANNQDLAADEVYSAYLKYPFTCGCTDANYLEYSPYFACNEPGSCIHPIVYGCMDTMSCNYDPKANFSLPSMCCYPGDCGDRDIAEVCPSLMGTTFAFDIYPNPATEKLNLHILTGISQPISYAIFNSFGVLIIEKDLGADALNFQEEIDLSSFDKGLYHVQVKTGEELKSELFIIQ